MWQKIFGVWKWAGWAWWTWIRTESEVAVERAKKMNRREAEISHHEIVNITSIPWLEEHRDSHQRFKCPFVIGTKDEVLYKTISTNLDLLSSGVSFFFSFLRNRWCFILFKFDNFIQRSYTCVFQLNWHKFHIIMVIFYLKMSHFT